MPKYFVSQLNSLQATTIFTLATVGLALSVASGASAAGFSGSYAPSNWTFSTRNFPNFPNLIPSASGNGSVNTSNAPISINLKGGSDSSGDSGRTDYITTAAGGGTVSFTWDYSNLDPQGVQFDELYYLINGNATLLSNSVDPIQNGNTSFTVQTGDSFGFRIQTDDNVGVAASAVFSNFTAPEGTPVVTTTPEPSSLIGLPLILGLGFLGKKRKSQP